MTVQEREVRWVQRVQLGLLVVILLLAVGLFFYFGNKYQGGETSEETAAVPETEMSTLFLEEIAELEQALRERGFTGR